MKFETWMDKIDNYMEDHYGIGVYDLEDRDYYGMWESGTGWFAVVGDITRVYLSI